MERSSISSEDDAKRWASSEPIIFVRLVLIWKWKTVKVRMRDFDCWEKRIWKLWKWRFEREREGGDGE